ncbi:hypothetical protein HHX47_DHR8000194 [Lentinula edodes]|nr:hypothetical protein HHX47_DHR8000194 [Lentinula edodes]
MSAGTVVNATQRVMVAFLALHDDVIHWPTARMKEEAKEWVEAATCAAWRNSWIFVDGTLIPLAEKPAYHGEAYFDRKSNYSLNVQVRIRSEHAVGHLKGRLQSLRGLCQQILDEQSHRHALEWVWTCLVIHTLIHIIEEGDVDSEWEELIQQGLSSESSESESDGHEHVQAEVCRESKGQRKCKKVQNDLFASGITE